MSTNKIAYLRLLILLKKFYKKLANQIIYAQQTRLASPQKKNNQMNTTI